MAHTADDGSLTFRRGIANLKKLRLIVANANLRSIPAETTLLPNYPNPFNPETWIPYRLAEDTDVTLTIYDAKGAVVRQLNLGYQPAGHYTNRAKGSILGWAQRKRRTGHKRAFISTTCPQEDYSATRKMLILK